MKEICVPLPRMPEATHAEVEVKVEGRSQTFKACRDTIRSAPIERVDADMSFSPPVHTSVVVARNAEMMNTRARAVRLSAIGILTPVSAGLELFYPTDLPRRVAEHPQ